MLYSGPKQCYHFFWRKPPLLIFDAVSLSHLHGFDSWVSGVQAESFRLVSSLVGALCLHDDHQRRGGGGTGGL